MKKLWLFGTFLAISTLAGCGGNFFTPPGTPYQKVKTAFSGVENSFKKVSTSRSRVPQKKLLWQDSSSTLDSLFSLYASEDNYGDVLEDLSYTEPPMIQFQCLKYAFDKIGEGYSFGTKYYDTVTGKVYVDVETGAEAEQTSAYEWNYNFLLALDINIDSNDLITADVSFGITISKGSDSYHADWYINMILDYDMEKENPDTNEESIINKGNPKTSLDLLDLNTLEDLLQEAIDNEDYQKAAQIRDEINRRK